MDDLGRIGLAASRKKMNGGIFCSNSKKRIAFPVTQLHPHSLHSPRSPLVLYMSNSHVVHSIADEFFYQIYFYFCISLSVY